MKNRDFFAVKSNSDVKRWVRSAKNLIKATQKSVKAHDDVKHIVLNHLVWVISEAGFLLKNKNYRPAKKDDKTGFCRLKMDKLATKYCSLNARKLLETKMGKGCERDHVFERKKIVGELLRKNPSIFEKIEKISTICLLTKKEHDGLKKVKNSDGWCRYIQLAEKRKNFKIFDRESGNEVKLKVLAASDIFNSDLPL